MELKRIDKELSIILDKLIASDDIIATDTKKVHKDFKLSAKNLYRYLILRSFDLRKYHDSLSDLGLSSLRTAEGYVLSNLSNVVKNVRLLQNLPMEEQIPLDKMGYRKSKKLLKKHANSLFNETSKKHFTEIMVTVPQEAIENREIIKEMVLSGMEIARIDLSYGNLEAWKKMVAVIHEVQVETKQKVKIYMDLAGPKIKTSTIKIHGNDGEIREAIPIKVGEHIILTKKTTFGKKSTFGSVNEQIEKAEIGVVRHEIIDEAKVGEAVLFGEGVVECKIIAKKKDEVELVVTSCYKSKLSSNERINLPDTVFNLPALTIKDKENLPFICENADIVGYSFLRTDADVDALYAELRKNNAHNLGVIFKIENKEAFENLPDILFAGMKRSKIGVMIARGDLAVEIGFERISEVQNQILWLCEAAHVPVIWATQVLESLIETGIPTRAEISDAAYSAKAECVMLNYGPYIIDAIRVLKDILIRMERHSFKKKNQLRALNISKKFVRRVENR